jgi:hypothetical protein
MNTRKLAYQRMKQLQQQKVGSTTIITPKVSKTTPKVRRRTDEIHAEMYDNFWGAVENKMIDLSRWSGEGSPYHYRELID